MYKYIYEKKEYTSDKVTAGLKLYTAFRFIAKRQAEGFKSGMTVDVYVNPDDNFESVLIPGVQILDIVVLLIGLSIILF